MMSEVLCIEVTGFSFFCLSQQLLRQSGKNQTCGNGEGEFGFRFTLKQSDQWEKTTLEEALKKSDLVGIFI